MAANASRPPPACFINEPNLRREQLVAQAVMPTTAAEMRLFNRKNVNLASVSYAELVVNLL